MPARWHEASQPRQGAPAGVGVTAHAAALRHGRAFVHRLKAHHRRQQAERDFLRRYQISVPRPAPAPAVPPAPTPQTAPQTAPRHGPVTPMLPLQGRALSPVQGAGAPQVSPLSLASGRPSAVPYEHDRSIVMDQVQMAPTPLAPLSAIATPVQRPSAAPPTPSSQFGAFDQKRHKEQQKHFDAEIQRLRRLSGQVETTFQGTNSLALTQSKIEQLRIVQQRRREMGMIGDVERPEDRVVFAKKDAECEPLSASQQRTYEDAISGTKWDDEVLSRVGVLQITRHDIRTLAPGAWLNDQVINGYLHMIAARCKANGVKMHMFNSFLFAKICPQPGQPIKYAPVRRWTRKIDLFALNLVLVPINLPGHWVLAVINLAKKRFEFYDSMTHSDRTGRLVCAALRSYLEAEHEDKKNAPLDLSGWTDYIPLDIPQQNNTNDCGVFLLKFSERVSSSQPFSFSQDNMPAIRGHIVLQILAGELYS